jgi:hypothetical protein
MATLKPVTESTRDAVSNAFSEASDLRDELQDWLDGIPENMQNGSKAEQLQEAINILENVQEPEYPDELDKQVTTRLWSGRKVSRPKRMSNAISRLSVVIEAIEDDEQLTDFKTDLENAAGEWETVEFPGMFG